MLKIMASHKEGEEEDDEEDLQEESNQSQSPTTLAAQVALSLSLPLLRFSIMLLSPLTTGLGYSCPVSSS